MKDKTKFFILAGIYVFLGMFCLICVPQPLEVAEWEVVPTSPSWVPGPEQVYSSVVRLNDAIDRMVEIMMVFF